MKPIPIANIYYLLCYAWDTLKNERDISEVGVLSNVTSMQALFARVLIGCMRAMRHRGFERGYQLRHGEIVGIRGKLLLTETYLRNLPTRSHAACEWDELEYDTLPNRILKATLRTLHDHHDLNKPLRDELYEILRWQCFDAVQDIHVATRHFGSVQLHSNNRAYEHPLHICEFIHENTIPDEQNKHSGARRFRNFERDALPKLFEKFVLNFYRRELPDWDVESFKIKWERVEENEDARKYLPDMQTDVCLSNRRQNRAIILDTKFYSNALAAGKYGTERLHSGNLYQIYTYLRQREREPGWEQADGVLLYPENGYNFDAIFKTHTHRIRAATLNLAEPWQDIAKKLKNLILQTPT